MVVYNRKSIQYVFIITCVIAILYPLINIYVIFPSFSQVTVKSAEEDAIRIAKSLSAIVVSSDNKLKEPEDFAGQVLKAKESFDLARIKVFSQSGEITYSTESRDIGKINDKPYFLEIVAKGSPYTKVVQKNSSTLEDQVLKVDVVETYVPIMRDTHFLGAFEIYFDITAINQALSEKVLRSSLILFILMFGFFIVAVFLISRSEKISDTPVESNTAASYQTPFYLMMVMAISIFISEVIVMFIVAELPSMPRISESLIDSTLLVMIVSPVLYYFLFRPLINQIEQRKLTEQKLTEAHIELGETNKQLICENTERQKAERTMFLAKQEWVDTFNAITDMITVHDMDFNLIKANDAAKKMLSLPLLTGGNVKCYQYYHGTDSPPEGCPSCACRQTEEPTAFEVFEPHLNMHVEIRAIPKFDENGRIDGMIHVVRDITERKKIEDRLKTLSLTDELTGLYNRRGFFTMLEQQIKVFKRQGNRMFLLYADLDKFKEINDTFGHQEGDRVLIEAAEMLKSTYRESDLIARLGGDEFVVFPVGDNETQVNLIIARLQRNIFDFNARENRAYMLSMSVGVAPFDPDSFSSIDSVLAEADRLMYKQKRQSKNT